MGSRRAHSEICRKRFEDEMNKDEVLERRVKARNTRKEKNNEPDQLVNEPIAMDHDDAHLFVDFRSDDEDIGEDEGEGHAPPDNSKRVRAGDDDGDNKIKRRKVEEAIKNLTKIIEDAKTNAKR